MEVSKIKRIITIGSAAVFGLWSVTVGFNYMENIQVLADDENEVEDDESPMQVIDTSPKKNQTQKTETTTIYKKLSDTISTKTDTITRRDSDGDELYDDEDSHPTINDYFIVKDGNLNGIDDRYEQ